MIRIFLCCAMATAMIGCGSKSKTEYPMEKPHWAAEDYALVVRQLKYIIPEGEKYPNLADPETSDVFKKLVNSENITVVTDDPALGLKHRANFTESLFGEYRELADIYSVMDREDKYVYDRELVEIFNFGLLLQIHYFKLGNDVILQESDNPEGDQVQRVVRDNENIIVSNFNNYLDLVNREKAFSEESLTRFAEGIDEKFEKLTTTFPKANYKITIEKAVAMKKKATNRALQTSLQRLIDRLTTKIQAAEAAAQPVN